MPAAKGVRGRWRGFRGSLAALSGIFCLLSFPSTARADFPPIIIFPPIIGPGNVLEVDSGGHICDAWSQQADFLNVTLGDGQDFTFRMLGSANAGDQFFVDLTVHETPAGFGYSFYFGPSTTFFLSPEDDATGFIGTLLYEADGSESDLQFTLQDRFQEGGPVVQTRFDLTNFRCTLTGGHGSEEGGLVVDLNALLSASTSGYAMVGGGRQSNFYVFRQLLNSVWVRQQSNRQARVNFSDSNPGVGGGATASFGGASGGAGETGSTASFFSTLVNGREEYAGMSVASPLDSGGADWRGFVMGAGSSYDQDAGANNPGISGRSWSGTAGFERILNPHLLLGFAITGGGGRSDVPGVTDIETDGVVGSGYLSVLKEGLHFDLRYALGALDIDMTRNAAAGVIGRARLSHRGD